MLAGNIEINVDRQCLQKLGGREYYRQALDQSKRFILTRRATCIVACTPSCHCLQLSRNDLNNSCLQVAMFTFLSNAFLARI